MGAVGGIVGSLTLPGNSSPLQQSLYPTVGTVIGLISGVLILFLYFTVLSYIQTKFAIMVKNAVNQASVHNDVTVKSPYPTPVILSDSEEGIPALRYLLNRGAELEPDLSPSGVSRWGWPQLEYWTQQWLDYVSQDVWRYIPEQASYVMNDEGLRIRDEVLKYVGWQSPLATRRVVFSYRLRRLREICAQVPELLTADPQT